MGIGDWGLGPIPNPQSPIPNPQSPIPNPLLVFQNNFFKLIIKFLFINFYQLTKSKINQILKK